jgi:hypothetical protein
MRNIAFNMINEGLRLAQAGFKFISGGSSAAATDFLFEDSTAYLFEDSVQFEFEDAPEYYLRPGGVDYYRRPGGVDRYLRP